jgi:predicted NBD/HSP70 family sugar kinase
VISSPNLPCWHNFHLGDAIRDEYGITTIVDNDANAAGLAEALWGAGAEYESIFCATIGTGIGTAIVRNKQLYYGHHAIAPEGGHMTIDVHAPCQCECGKRGCLEGMASGPSMARRARERLASAKSFDTALWGSDLNQITTRTIAAAWRAGDPIATELLRETSDLYAVWLGNIIDLIEPAAIVIGGGLSGLFSEWFGFIKQQLPSCSIIPGAGEIPLLTAKFGSDAGIIGAAALCQLKTRIQYPVTEISK